MSFKSGSSGCIILILSSSIQFFSLGLIRDDASRDGGKLLKLFIIINTCPCSVRCSVHYAYSGSDGMLMRCCSRLLRQLMYGIIEMSSCFLDLSPWKAVQHRFSVLGRAALRWYEKCAPYWLNPVITPLGNYRWLLHVGVFQMMFTVGPFVLLSLTVEQPDQLALIHRSPRGLSSHHCGSWQD